MGIRVNACSSAKVILLPPVGNANAVAVHPGAGRQKQARTAGHGDRYPRPELAAGPGEIRLGSPVVRGAQGGG